VRVGRGKWDLRGLKLSQDSLYVNRCRFVDLYILSFSCVHVIVLLSNPQEYKGTHVKITLYK
jgi:hypothetical protein